MKGEGERMRKAVVLDAKDIKRILSEQFKVSEDNVIKSQYSYTVIMEEGAEAPVLMEATDE